MDDTRLRLLYDLSCAFAEQTDLDVLVPSVIVRARDLFDADGASILLLDGKTNELYFPYVAEEDPEIAANLLRLRLPADQGIAGYVLQNAAPTKSDSVRDDSRFFQGADEATQTETGPLLGAPLICRQSTIGVIEVIRRVGAPPFTEPDLEFLATLASSVAVAIDNARRYGETKESKERLEATVDALTRDLARRDREYAIIGGSEATRELLQLIDTAASHPITVLIQGETGTGKELVARRIHYTSARHNGPFIPVNCAALPQGLLESELFGHRKGSFTDAIQDRTGLFEAASGGTIFLDEIGECPPEMQAKLLRVLQEGEIVPVGETKGRKVDVRVVSATNRDLAVEVADGAFREDLFYRLSAFPIELKPLRDREDDIPLLVDAFIGHANEKHGREVSGVDDDAMEILMGSHWSGNVRQLQNEVERAVVLAAAGAITARHLSPELITEIADMPVSGLSADPMLDSDRVRGEDDGDEQPSSGTTMPLREARARFEASYIRRVLISNGGNVSATSRALGMSRFMVQKKLKEYGIK